MKENRIAMIFFYTLILFLFEIALVEPSFSEGYENVETHGFLLGNFAGRTIDQKKGEKKKNDFLLAEERFRMNVSTWSNSIDASARINIDFFEDMLTGKSDLSLREAYIDYAKGDFDFRIGRQISTWGVGDFLFINDIFPKDWESFFSGRPLEYLKIGVDGFRIRHTSNVLSSELIVIPFFEPDILPNPDRFSMFNPFKSILKFEEEQPEPAYGNTEFAVRLYRKIGDFDISGYAYRGFWRTPGMKPDDIAPPTMVTAFYPELSVYGFSSQKSVLGGIVSFETGYYQSREDEHGDNPVIPNSQSRLLIGYGRQLREDLHIGFQYYAEFMEDYSTYKKFLLAGFPAQKEYHDIVTLRLEQLMKHQTWRLSFFSFYSPVDDDYLIQPQASYKFSDNLSVNLGANVFGGVKNTTFLGQFDRNDNLFLSVRFDL